MKAKQMTFTGKKYGQWRKATARQQGEFLLVEMFVPNWPDPSRCWARADSKQEIWLAAHRLYYFLKPYPGPVEGIYGMFRQLLLLRDFCRESRNC